MTSSSNSNGTSGRADGSTGEPRVPLRNGQQGPLKDVIVLDCSMVWAGPYCTKLLGDMGATIIKIEANRQLDSIRGPAIPPPIPLSHYANDDPGEDPWNRSGYFNKTNRNKLGMCMNILMPEGREVFMELAKIADVVIENFGGGVFERMGYGYDVIKAVNDDIVYVSMPPSGNGGPEARYVGYGVAIEQLGGIVARTGYLRDGMPMKSGINYGDPIAGIHTAGYIMTALLHRRKTGRGQYVDLSQRECSINWTGESVLEYQITGEEPTWIGNRDHYMAPSGAYRCQGEDAWVALAVGSDAEWSGLCEAIGRPELRGQYATLEARKAAHAEIDLAISEWTKGRGADDAMTVLQQHGVAAGVSADSRRVVEDPHLKARSFYPEVDHISAGRHRLVGPAWNMDRTPGAVYAAAPALGQHNDFVLREILGKSEAEVQALRDAGVLETTPAEILAQQEAAKAASGD
ncbi:MAG: CoA transferase [Dehalococcoidia bacterium]|nr:CoA transferase [Dehalococcoidia bacterium]